MRGRVEEGETWLCVLGNPCVDGVLAIGEAADGGTCTGESE